MPQLCYHRDKFFFFLLQQYFTIVVFTLIKWMQLWWANKKKADLTKTKLLISTSVGLSSPTPFIECLWAESTTMTPVNPWTSRRPCVRVWAASILSPCRRIAPWPAPSSTPRSPCADCCAIGQPGNRRSRRNAFPVTDRWWRASPWGARASWGSCVGPTYFSLFYCK